MILGLKSKERYDQDSFRVHSKKESVHVQQMAKATNSSATANQIPPLMHWRSPLPCSQIVMILLMASEAQRAVSSTCRR